MYLKVVVTYNQRQCWTSRKKKSFHFGKILNNKILLLQCWKLSLGLEYVNQVLYHWVYPQSISPALIKKWYIFMIKEQLKRINTKLWLFPGMGKWKLFICYLLWCLGCSKLLQLAHYFHNKPRQNAYW